jgi:excinuclease ABC subunit B
MREAAADLEFETAARLRDEVKRLRQTELAIADDPLARQADVEERAGTFAGQRKYGGAPKERRSAPSRSPKGVRPLAQPSMQDRDAGGEGSDPLPSRIARDYQPVQPTFAQTSTVPGTRARKPSLDEMGSHSNRPIPARPSPSPRSSRGEGRGEGQELAPRHPDIDPRTKAGAYGEKIAGPHKPTLDEMGPHAERGLPVGDKPRPRAPPGPPPPGGEGLGVGGSRTAPPEKRTRRGRPRKTGRPGA